MPERRTIRLTDRQLSSAEIQERTRSTVQVVMSVCRYTELKIDRAFLFGFLAREEGDTGSDADVLFLSSNRSITNIKEYLRVSDELKHHIDRYEEFLKVCNFLISPLFALQAWMDEPRRYSYVVPTVLENIKKEGILVWSKE